MVAWYSTKYGAWQWGDGKGMRVGITDSIYEGPTITTDSTTYQFYTGVWIQADAAGARYSADAQTLIYGDALNGYPNYNYNNSLTPGQSTSLDYTHPYTHTYTTWGAVEPITLSVAVTGYDNPSMPQPTASFVRNIPARPFKAAMAVTEALAIRVSDTSATLSWTPHTSAQQPSTFFNCYIRNFVSTWSNWIAVNGSAASPNTVTSQMTSNKMYQFDVKAYNSGGTAPSCYTNVIYMTPAAPANVIATKAGSVVNLTWTTGSYVDNAVKHNIERQVDGGAWTSMVTDLPRTTLAWTDNNPTGAVVLYRVCTTAPGVTSAWTVSNTSSFNNCWVWDGTTEVPSSAFVWDGTTEVPTTISVA